MKRRPFGDNINFSKLNMYQQSKTQINLVFEVFYEIALGVSGLDNFEYKRFYKLSSVLFNLFRFYMWFCSTDYHVRWMNTEILG